MKYYCEIPEVWALEFLEPMDFDGWWISSLTRSWQKGYPDNGTLPWTDYTDYVRRLRNHTRREIAVDCEGLYGYGDPSIAATVAKEFETAGASALCIESKVFPKANSFCNDVKLAKPEHFLKTVEFVCDAIRNVEVLARLEYLYVINDPEAVAQIGEECIKAGASSVVLHWKDTNDLAPLKEALKILRSKKIETGIIPTRFLPAVISGEFDDLAGFSILGNCFSSSIREYCSKLTRKNLLEPASDFRPLLERAEDYKIASK